jgi:hypothetical protein
MAKDTKPADALALSPELEVEKLRLQNENLKLQLEIEQKRNPPKPEELLQKISEERLAAERKAIDELADGTPDKPLPFKFHVHLPGNFPTTQPREAPHLVVGASQGGIAGGMEAAQRYNAHMGIRHVNASIRHVILEVGKGQVDLPQAVPSVDFTPAGASPSGLVALTG